MTEGAVLTLLERRVKECGGALGFARKHRMSVQFLCDVRKRRRGLSARILEALGLVAFIDYREMKKVCSHCT